MDRVRAVLKKLNEVSNRTRLAGMARYGIAIDKALGVPVPELRRLAKAIGRDHDLAVELWGSEIQHQVCGNLFDRTAYASRKAVEWNARAARWIASDALRELESGRAGTPARAGSYVGPNAPEGTEAPSAALHSGAARLSARRRP